MNSSALNLSSSLPLSWTLIEQKFAEKYNCRHLEPVVVDTNESWRLSFMMLDALLTCVTEAEDSIAVEEVDNDHNVSFRECIRDSIADSWVSKCKTCSPNSRIDFPHFLQVIDMTCPWDTQENLKDYMIGSISGPHYQYRRQVATNLFGHIAFTLYGYNAIIQRVVHSIYSKVQVHDLLCFR